MKVFTTRDVIRRVADKWHSQYQPFANDSAPWCGKTKSGIWQELVALNKETATAEQVNAIIGNEYWTRMKCDECAQEVDWLIRLGQEPEYESSTASLCQECLRKAAEHLPPIQTETPIPS